MLDVKRFYFLMLNAIIDVPRVRMFLSENDEKPEHASLEGAKTWEPDRCVYKRRVSTAAQTSVILHPPYQNPLLRVIEFTAPP